MEEIVSDLFKELAACCQFKWRGMNPEYKLVWKIVGAAFALLVFAAAVSGLALLVGPR